jgi:hypothetical protein
MQNIFFGLIGITLISGCTANPNATFSDYSPPKTENIIDSRDNVDNSLQEDFSKENSFTSATGEKCWIIDNNNLTSLCENNGSIKKTQNIISNSL